MKTGSRHHRIGNIEGTTTTCSPVLTDASRSCLEPGRRGSSLPHRVEGLQVHQPIEGEREPDASLIAHTYRVGSFMTGIIVIW